jgi:CheY-like chemotaxis protein
MFNLVSNAVRYTSRGGLVVGCRQRDEVLRLEVWDTGAGIPADQRQDIFAEFYRLGEPERDRRAGLGLGLAMVDRLCRLLDHPIDLTSTVGRGSRFAIRVPIVSAREESTRRPVTSAAPPDMMDGRLVVIIDDDPLVLEGMGGLFRSWGCEVIPSSTDNAVAARVAEHQQTPDLIVSDYHLSDGKTGIDAIERLRREFRSDTPAFLISGDTNPGPLREARAGGLQLLHKPVAPMTLRAMTSRMLGRVQAA